MGFWKQLISDNNTINEKSFVGVISFFMMVIAFLVDIITGVLGRKLVIEEFIFNGFLMLTSVVFGITTAGEIFKRKEKKEKENENIE
jgi:undecaprenyl pyrophosphate phosphatase UppP